MTVTGVMLAGGQSRRMGADKAALIGPRVEAILRACFPAVLVIRDDDRPGLGPIGGLATALRRVETDAIFVAACDMPFLDAALIRELVELLPGYDAVVPQVGEYGEPLHAVYHRRCLPVVEEQIAAGDYSLQHLVRRLHTRFVHRPNWGRTLTNINTPAEWRAVESERRRKN
jgi:molybdopterin-guanine dinucleotide biosynthesis protein A